MPPVSSCYMTAVQGKYRRHAKILNVPVRVFISRKMPPYTCRRALFGTIRLFKIKKFIQCMSFHILARQFLTKATNSPNLRAGTYTIYHWEGDPLECCLLISRHWLRLWFKTLCIQFVRFATLYSYLALYVY